MQYTIRQLADLAGVSARTLRYYDEIGLLKPCGISESGYRLYGEREVNLLQQILFYRERGFDLKQIQKIVYQDDFDIMCALQEHLLKLEECVTAGKEPESEDGKQVVRLHREWLGMTWKKYSKEAHIGLAAMYTADERFTAYYDKNVAGCAEFLEKAVQCWAGQL